MSKMASKHGRIVVARNFFRGILKFLKLRIFAHTSILLHIMSGAGTGEVVLFFWNDDGY